MLLLFNKASYTSYIIYSNKLLLVSVMQKVESDGVLCVESVY